MADLLAFLFSSCHNGLAHKSTAFSPVVFVTINSTQLEHRFRMALAGIPLALIHGYHIRSPHVGLLQSSRCLDCGGGFYTAPYSPIEVASLVIVYSNVL